jgi:hypothetical protein
MQDFSTLAFKGEALGVAQISVNGDFFPKGKRNILLFGQFWFS